MSLFTLTQKIFVIKCYYVGGESARHALKCMMKRYGKHFDQHNLDSIQQIISLFEKTGSVQNRVNYVPANSSIDAIRMKMEIKVDAEGDVQILQVPDVIEEVSENEFESRPASPTNESYEVIPGPSCYEEVTAEQMEEEDVIAAAEASEGKPIIIYTEPKKPDAEIVCPDCGESIPRTKIHQHRKTQHPEQWKLKEKFKCESCTKEYVNKFDLENHKKIHHSDGNFPKIICEICGKESTNKYIHKTHLLTHSADKPYSCNDCPMTFRRPQALRRHRMTHTGEKPLVCKVCGAAFAAHMTLAMHMRLHTGERPYECEHCHKRFVGRPALNSHLKVQHGGEYLNECGLCGGRFKTEKTLKEHFLKKHNITEDQLDI